MIELIFDADCPNADAAREMLRQALTIAGRDPAWVEWDRESPDSPAHARQFGSPTILVNKRDVSGKDTESDANSCRVYQDENSGFAGVPSKDDILAALRASDFADALTTEMGAGRMGQALAGASLRIIRELAKGRPLSWQAAALGGVEAADLRERVEMLGADFDEAGNIVGFGGLSLRPTSHRMLLTDGREFFAWCAADTLFLPALIGEAAEVGSSCPETGRPIRLRVSPAGLEEASPAEAVVSMLAAGEYAAVAESCRGTGAPIDQRGAVGVAGSFCGSVHFFADREAAAGWESEHPGSMVLGLDEAARLARELWSDPLLAAERADS